MIESRGGRQVIALDVDGVRTPADEPLHRRLLTISETVEYWMDTHLPDVIAIERVFANQNATTAMGTAQAGGVIALAAARRFGEVELRQDRARRTLADGSTRLTQLTARLGRFSLPPARWPRPCTTGCPKAPPIRWKPAPPSPAASASTAKPTPSPSP
jgi:crossover junction endodeoxyribonuclease RuvC